MSVSWAVLHVVRDVALANGGRENTVDCIADRALLICPAQCLIRTSRVYSGTNVNVPPSARSTEG